MNFEAQSLNVLFGLIFVSILFVSAYYLFLKPISGRDRAKSEYRSFKDKNRNKNWLNFIWRKKYRELLWFIGVFGAGFVIFIDNVLRDLTIEAKDELSAALLFITAVMVFWYTREAYDLKVITQKDVTQNRITQMNEFLPILVPNGHGIIQGGNIQMNILNAGKGIAKNLNIWVAGVTVLENLTLQANSSHGLHIRDNENIRMLTTDGSIESFSMEFAYKDVYERTIRTAELTFSLDRVDPSRRFVLDEHRWKFKVG